MRLLGKWIVDDPNAHFTMQAYCEDFGNVAVGLDPQVWLVTVLKNSVRADMREMTRSDVIRLRNFLNAILADSE
jgi:hypothetical protein